MSHFGIRENDEVYYLKKEQITELLVLFIFTLDSFGELIDHVTAGRKDITDALEETGWELNAEEFA